MILRLGADMGRQGLGDSGKKILSVGQKELKHTHTHALECWGQKCAWSDAILRDNPRGTSQGEWENREKKKKKTRGF